jgi:hypothetical protein
MIAFLPKQVFHMNNEVTAPKRTTTTIKRMALWTAARIKPPAMKPIKKSRINDHKISFGKVFLKEKSSSWLRTVTAWL